MISQPYRLAPVANLYIRVNARVKQNYTSHGEKPRGNDKEMEARVVPQEHTFND